MILSEIHYDALNGDSAIVFGFTIEGRIARFGLFGTQSAE
jgi:hypothetical protein